jgi:DNA replication protein DnaC
MGDRYVCRRASRQADATKSRKKRKLNANQSSTAAFRFTDLAIAHGDGRYTRLLRTISRAKLLILDDWGPETLTPDQARDLLEIVEDRYDAGSVMITSQVPVDRWHDMIGVPTLADAILDRVIHNAYRINLAGESLRKQRSSP